MNKIFLDLETTGLDPNSGDKIIEIACIKINKTNITTFHKYLNPKKIITEEAYKIHGIKNEFLLNKPLFKDIVFKFLNYINGSKLIIHNASFDTKFLNSELKNLGFKTIDKYCYKILDTLKLSRKIYKNKRNSLESLCKRFNIDYSFRKKHGALIDAKLLFIVYLNLKSEVNKFKILKNDFKKKNYNKSEKKKFFNLFYKEEIKNNYYFNFFTLNFSNILK